MHGIVPAGLQQQGHSRLRWTATRRLVLFHVCIAHSRSERHCTDFADRLRAFRHCAWGLPFPSHRRRRLHDTSCKSQHLRLNLQLHRKRQPADIRSLGRYRERNCRWDYWLWLDGSERLYLAEDHIGWFGQWKRQHWLLAGSEFDHQSAHRYVDGCQSKLFDNRVCFAGPTVEHCQDAYGKLQPRADQRSVLSDGIERGWGGTDKRLGDGDGDSAGRVDVGVDGRDRVDMPGQHLYPEQCAGGWKQLFRYRGSGECCRERYLPASESSNGV